jgi:probable rRNA maturation factor
MEITITNNQRLIKINRRKIKKVLRKTLQYLKDSGKLNQLLITHYPSLEISILFVNDHRMRDLNLQYRGKDKTTDVLSFPQTEVSSKQYAVCSKKHKAGNKRSAYCLLPTAYYVLGDIVISLPQAKRQAQENSKFTSKLVTEPALSLSKGHSSLLFYEEVTRLLIHGLLHLLGYDHERNKYQARKMKRIEKELFGVTGVFP